MQKSANTYLPPKTREELLQRYANGERHFPDTDLSGSDLSQIMLDDAKFERSSWFFDTNFEGASLRNTSFKECNVKCANFSRADLTGASFELAAIESIELMGATLEGSKFKGATFYGYSLDEGEMPPTRTK